MMEARSTQKHTFGLMATSIDVVLTKDRTSLGLDGCKNYKF